MYSIHKRDIFIISIAVCLFLQTNPANCQQNSKNKIKQYALQITSMSSWSNPDYLTFNVTWKHPATVSFVTDITRTIDNMWMHMLLKIRERSSATQKFTTFMNNSIDYCGFLQNTISNPLLKIIYAALIDPPVNHYFRTCPIAPVS